MIFTKEMLTSFVYMPPDEWRALTVSMGVLYRVRLYKETHIVDRVHQVFGDNIPQKDEWDAVRHKVNTVRRQVRDAGHSVTGEAGVATNELHRVRKRDYQRDYMRRYRATQKARAGTDGDG